MHDNWWESGPVFSTTDHGGRITVVPPGQMVSRLRLGHLAAIVSVALVCAVAMTLALPASLPPLAFGLGLGYGALLWWIPLTLLAVFGMIHVVPVLFDFMEQEFQQKSVALRAATVAVSAGLAGACLVWSWLLSRAHSEYGIEDLLRTLMLGGAALFAVVALGALPLLFLAVRQAAKRTEAIVALREHGKRFLGEIVEVPDPKLWLLGRPQFRITVRYGEPGDERTLNASMSTSHERVPMPGSPVLVYVSADGATYVEVDPERPPTYATNTTRYRASSDGGA